MRNMQILIGRFYTAVRFALLSGIAVLLFSAPVYSQQVSILESYIKQGLENNLALKQREMNLEKNLQALKEANSLFFPSVTFEAQYTAANGGRTINLPVGDMLNPVYYTLNQMLQNNGQPGNFPQIKNEEIAYLPNDYHDTKVRVVLPLVNAEIYYNRKIKKEMISVAQAEVNVYKRELVKEIKVAYIRYLQSMKVADAYKSAMELVNEALRVNKKLVDNQMAGPEKLYRIESEQNQVNSQLVKAENDMRIAASYFNFLLNMPLQTQVVVDSLLLNAPMANSLFDKSITISGREELAQLQSAIKSSDYLTKMKKSYLIPTISNITDLGYQGYYYKFDKDQRYVLNVVSLTWPIFNGFQNRRKIAQAHIQTRTLQTQLTETERQIELQGCIAEGNLESSMKSEEASHSSLVSSKEYYKVVSKQYANGQKSLLDLLDARNQLTNAEISFTMSRFERLIRLAELERANASYNLNLVVRK